jgi:hypothetical protein
MKHDELSNIYTLLRVAKFKGIVLRAQKEKALHALKKELFKKKHGL